MRELEILAELPTSAEVHDVGALRPGMVASAVRVAYDPWSRPGLARLASSDPRYEGLDEAAAWPVAADTTWSRYRTDGFFFQAEDGIRYFHVTGVQTCALPI